METKEPGAQIAGPKAVIRALAALAVAIETVVLLTWMVGVVEFSGVFPSLRHGNPTTAACFALLGLGLLGAIAKLPAMARIAPTLTGGLVASVGIARLVSIVTNTDLGVDRLLFAERIAAFQAPMSSSASSCLVLLGAALALSSRRSLVHAVQFCAVAAIIVAFVTCLSYLYGAVGLYSFTGHGTMALPTVVSTFALALGILVMRPSAGPVGLLTASNVGGVYARRALPALTIGLVLLGIVRVYSIRFDLLILPLGTSIFVTSAVILASIIILLSSRMLGRYDAELRRQNAALERSREAAAEANKAKSTFLAGMSHEIRTPLNGVLGFAELLRTSDLSDEQRHHLDRLREAGQSLLAIISDILDLSKIEAGKLVVESVPISLAATVDGVASIMLAQVRAKGLAFRTDVAEDLPPWIEGDPTRVRQILLNYLSNAVKFTSTGEIAVAVARGADVGGQTIRFEVADTGIGIPADRQGMLFKDFSQADQSTTRRFGGTGLGLAISRRLAEAMGGEVGVVSEPGAGSRFWFTITGAPCAPPRIEESSERLPGIAARPARVLVADDVEINRIIVNAMLTASGHSVGLVDDGLAALEAVRDGDYDLVLMDMEMPKMDGVTATRAIRKLSGPIRDIPIVALTANAMLEDLESCKAAGMNDYLAKPINRNALLVMVAKWSGGHAAGKVSRSGGRAVVVPEG